MQGIHGNLLHTRKLLEVVMESTDDRRCIDGPIKNFGELP